MILINSLIRIDGSLGEGGGQILRSALSLSALTGKPFEIYNIRSNRKKPGLRPQHLLCVNATTKICEAEITGAEVGSTTVTFIPGEVKSGEYCFEVGTAGAVSLVLHSIYLPLSMLSTHSQVTIGGGTHVPFSPCYHYLVLQWLPYIKKIGFDIDLELKTAGFYPMGNGEINVLIKPVGSFDDNFKVKKLNGLQLVNRGRLKVVKGVSAVGNLDLSIAERQKTQAVKRLTGMGLENDIIICEMPAFGKGTMLLLEAVFENATCCYFSLGARGKRAESVADDACNELVAFLNGNGAVDEYLADQVLIALALCNKHSKISVSKITSHILTNINIINMFVDAKFKVEGCSGSSGIISVN